jgi:hypothetical protein
MRQDFAFRRGRESDEAADFDMIVRDRMRAAVQVRHAADGQDIAADPANVGAHGVQHPAEALDVRFARRVGDDRLAVRANGGHDCIFRCHDTRFIEENIAADEAVRFHRIKFPSGLDRHAEFAQGVDVRIEPAASDFIAARRGQGNPAFAAEHAAGE